MTTTHDQEVDAFLERARQQREREVLFSRGLVLLNVESQPWDQFHLFPGKPLSTFGRVFGEWAWVGRVYS
jgi:hypothetical protein